MRRVTRLIAGKAGKDEVAVEVKVVVVVVITKEVVEVADGVEVVEGFEPVKVIGIDETGVTEEIDEAKEPEKVTGEKVDGTSGVDGCEDIILLELPANEWDERSDIA